MTYNIALWWWLAHQKPANSESSGHDPDDMSALALLLVAVFLVVAFLT